jgi:NAD(P)-dependent dehydrogenase (short-subunit alcohol dehydrogenase family)
VSNKNDLLGKLFSLEGKVVLITGASRGLGRAIAEGFSKAGAYVIVSSRKQEACEEVVNEISKQGGKSTAIAAHAGDMRQLDELIKTSVERCGKVDVLVNNAAISVGMGGLHENDEKFFDKMNDVNLKGPWYLASRIAPIMRDNGGGNIINVISVGGLKPGPFAGVYCANKAALYALTKTMASEWASWNVRVNALAPGPYSTDMFNTAADALPGFKDASMDATEMKRIADPEELVGSALYLASNASSYTTGTVVVSDGGYLV